MAVDLAAIQARAIARLRATLTEDLGCLTVAHTISAATSANVANLANAATPAGQVRALARSSHLCRVGPGSEVSQVSQVSRIDQPAEVSPSGLSDDDGGLPAVDLDPLHQKADASDAARRATALRARLARWGWPIELADETAQRLVARDAHDKRVTCIDCVRYAPERHRCLEPIRAGLGSGEVGPALAGLPQSCPGHATRPDWPAGPTDSSSMADE